MIYLAVIVMSAIIAVILTLLAVFFSVVYSKMIIEMEDEDVRRRKSDM